MPTGIAAKTSPKKSPKPKPLESLTQAELERREKFREYGRKGGLARKNGTTSQFADEAEAHESIKKDWAQISEKLAKQALKVARDPQKVDGRSLVALTTAAGIAYDKRWSKQVSDSQDIDIPASLASKILGKLSKPLIDKESECMVQGKPCTDGEGSSESSEPAPDPMLLSPGL